MDIWKMVGSFSLGTVVGLIGRYFFERFEKFTPAGLGSLLACLLGGTAVGYLTNWLKDPPALAVYPVGLLVGIVLVYRVIPTPVPKNQDAQKNDNKQNGAIEISPAVAPAGQLVQPDPTFVLLEVQKTLRIHSVDGSRSHLQRWVKMRANARAQTFWICTISADGSIENITVDASVDVDTRVEPHGGTVDIYADFRAATEPGDQIDIRLEYDLVNTFLTADEYLGHQIQHETEKVRLLIELPQGRPCISGDLDRRYAGDTTHVKGMRRSSTGMRLEGEIMKPRLGEKYRLWWHW